MANRNVIVIDVDEKTLLGIQSVQHMGIPGLRLCQKFVYVIERNYLFEFKQRENDRIVNFNSIEFELSKS